MPISFHVTTGCTIPDLLHKRLSSPHLYAITPDIANTGELISKVRDFLDAQGILIQYRNKTASARHRQRQATRLANEVISRNGILIINDDPLLAKHVHASGVHIGQHDCDLKTVQVLLDTSTYIIGCSCYDHLDRALRYQAQGAQYCTFGSLYPSITKTHAPRTSLQTLQRAKKAGIQVLGAIGGITLDRIPVILQAGVQLLCVSHDLFSAPDVAQQTTRYRGAIDQQYRLWIQSPT